MLVLLVEDILAEARLTQEALRETGLDHELCLVNDGGKAACAGSPTPGRILPDLSPPRKHSHAPEDIEKVGQIKGICCLSKPSGLKDLFAMVRTMVDFWFRIARPPSAPLSVFPPLPV